MRVAIKLLIVGILGLMLITAPSAQAAIIISETGDAGDLPISAQVTVGVEPIQAIQGKLIGVDDIDMFKIYISDLSLFSATTVNAGTEFLDTQLFLFDENGIGVAMNDDETFGVEARSTLPAGSLSGGPGSYYLAIALLGDSPESAGGLIFPDLFTGSLPFPDDVVTNTGLGGASPISGWIVDGFTESDFDPFPESYEIQLSGADPALASAVVPEPSSLTLFAIGLASVGAWRTGRRHRFRATN